MNENSPVDSAFKNKLPAKTNGALCSSESESKRFPDIQFNE